jgi:hypothetical protein
MFGGGAFGSGGGAGGAAAAGAFGGGGGVADSGLTEDGLKAHFEARERRLRGEPEDAGDGDSSVLAADKLLGLSDDSGRDTMNRSLRQAVLDESDHTGGNAEDEDEEWRGASKRRAAAAAAAGAAGAGGDGNLVAESLGVPAPVNISVKRLKLRLSGSARKSQKRFRDTPTFKFQAVLARIQPFQRSNERSERGDHRV